MILGAIFAAIMMPAAPLAHFVPEATQAAPKKERRICKRETETGSLVVKKKICMTKSQWEEQEREAKAVVEDLQNHSHSRPNG